VPRQTKQELDDEIIETAATLFARHGFKQTSVQSIADAVGYSKAGLLHRYPSKEALQDAVIDRCLTLMRTIVGSVADRTPGPDRDRQVITALVDLAIRRPGSVALLISLLTTLERSEVDRMQAIGEAVFTAFAVDPCCDPDRTTRVIGALGALTIARLALQTNPPPDLATHLLAVSFDALGHPRPAAD
jgi:AcrR family transcriptional regulator